MPLSFIFLIWHDIRQYTKQLSTFVTVCLFYLCIIIVIPFGLDGNVSLLAQSGTSFIWISFLLCCLLCVERQFLHDMNNDILDILYLRFSSTLICLSKAISVWITVLLPLILITPISCFMLHVPAERILPLMLSLLVGSPCMALIITLGGVLSLSHNRGVLVMGVLCMPLCVPILIFGIGSVTPTSYGVEHNMAGLTLLFALDLLGLAILPWASGEILRIELENK